MYSRLVIPCLALGALLGPLTARGAPTVTTRGAEAASRIVRFGDLNLDSHSGIETLYTRIKSAAKEVCEPLMFSSSHTYLRLRRCQERAVGQAVADVQSSQLTTFHMSMTDPMAAARAR
jgi:UrcA family protein